MKKTINISGRSSKEEIENRQRLLELLKNTPIPDNEILNNMGVYLTRNAISRILFMHELYRKILDVPGMIAEFGVRWGQNLSLFESFRALYEPYNYNRKIIGFDTFEGFLSVDLEKDKGFSKAGDYSVTEGYEKYLMQIMDYHERDNPISHIKKYELIKGDAPTELKKYLGENPETMFALIYLDMDVYRPTKDCLEAISGHITKGSVIVFDELNFHLFPGETLALQEVWGLDRYRIYRSAHSPLAGYIVIE